MKKHFIACITLLFSTLAISAPGEASDRTGRVANEKHEDRSREACDLIRSPLTRCDIYIDYKESDKKLNRSYRALLKKLPTTDASSLRRKQRQWVEFRDKTCLDLQEKAACDNALCDGVEHDQCILELTNIRTKELNLFLKDPSLGVRAGYGFETKYPLSSF